MRIVWRGNPITKKNHGRIVYISSKTGKKIPTMVPSAAYKRYEGDCIAQMTGACKKLISDPVNVKCVYYMQKQQRVDLLNLLSATCDILVRAGVLEDDNSQIVVGHDGSRVFYDKDDPRVEIDITEV